MKRLGLCLMTAYLALHVMQAEALTTAQILESAYDSTTKTLRMSYSASGANDVTALTNEPTYPWALQHETSGAPANGIGVGLRFIQETSAANNETIAAIAAVVSDVTAGSEDATNPPTIADAGNFALSVCTFIILAPLIRCARSAAWNPGIDDNICLHVQADNDYIEISRSNN